MLPFKDENPSSTTPVVTYGLIVVNITVFLYQVFIGGDYFTVNYGMIPREVLTFSNLPHSPETTPMFTVFTSMFLHGGVIHIASNLLYLFIFGDNVEDALGHVKFVLFYCAGGIAAALAQMLSSPLSVTPVIGASGAIAAVLGAYLVLYPQARVKTLVIFFIIPLVWRIPAGLILGFWFVMQLLRGLGGGGENVAWFAHIGGFVFGIFLINKLLGKVGKQRVEIHRRRYLS